MARFREILDATDEVLKAEINKVRLSIDHSGEKGTDIEGAFINIFEKLVPGKIGLTSGFVVDQNDNTSKQLDVIFYDRLNCPVLYTSGRNKVLPVDGTYMAAEIKTDMNGGKLKDSFATALSYKKLKRQYNSDESSIIKTYKLFGQEFNSWQSIFISFSLKSISRKCLEKHYISLVNAEKLNHYMRVDSVFSLSGPCVFNVLSPVNSEGVPQDGSIDLLPTATSRVASYYSKSPMTFMFLLISKYLIGAPATKTNLMNYQWGGPF